MVGEQPSCLKGPKDKVMCISEYGGLGVSGLSIQFKVTCKDGSKQSYDGSKGPITAEKACEKFGGLPGGSTAPAPASSKQNKNQPGALAPRGGSTTSGGGGDSKGGSKGGDSKGGSKSGGGDPKGASTKSDGVACKQIIDCQKRPKVCEALLRGAFGEDAPSSCRGPEKFKKCDSLLNDLLS